ncbi:MAG: WbqC family protein, partial [Lutibacter sp.]
MKIAINQPFTFPYIGFYQLVSVVDKFIFYDDVAFMKQSWINRNRILINGKDSYFTIQLEAASSFKLISETEILYNPVKINKILKTFQQAYAKAPYICKVMPILEDCFNAIHYEKRISKIAYISDKSI